MSTNRPTISVIILGYRNFDNHTLKCLETLNNWAQDQRFEFIVIDNGSPDESATKTLSWCTNHPGFNPLITQRNLGFSGGMNLGAKQSRGHWLLLVSNDTLFPKGALDALLGIVDTLPKDVAILCPVTNQAGNGQKIMGDEQTIDACLKVGQSLIEHPTGQLFPTYRADFFCVAIRQSVWRELGGLDTVFGSGYYEDFDFSLRAQKAGYKALITEDVFVAHVGSATLKDDAEQKELLKQNKKLLRMKHPDAKFEHIRNGNFSILEKYSQLPKSVAWRESFRMRLALRFAILEEEVPRSPFKRLRWKLRTRECRSQIVDTINLGETIQPISTISCE